MCETKKIKILILGISFIIFLCCLFNKNQINRIGLEIKYLRNELRDLQSEVNKNHPPPYSQCGYCKDKVDKAPYMWFKIGEKDLILCDNCALKLADQSVR